MKALLLSLLTVLLCITVPLPAYADGSFPVLDAEIVSTDGIIQRIFRNRLLFVVVENRTGKEFEYHLFDSASVPVSVNGLQNRKFSDLKPGMRVLVRHYKSSKGKKLIDPGDELRNWRAPVSFDNYAISIKASSQT